ncbi:hypothetical protein P3W45_001085 [Vairimorpha bombi]|jgi:serine/threonine protein kinase KIN1/2
MMKNGITNEDMAAREINNEDSESMLDDSLTNTGNIEEYEYVEDDHLCYYKIIKLLGTGSSSKVVLGVNTLNNEHVAIKIVKRKDKKKFIKSDIRIFREIIMSSLINHPYIVRLKDFMFSRSNYFLIFEYINGRQLYDVIVDEGYVNEKDARRYFRQILSAVDYIHKNSIVHRDMKIENILLDENDNIKIIDFGLSNFYDNKMLLNTFCGSLYFAAPELLRGNRYCGPEIDVWSLGVILYVLLNGSVPFDDKDVAHLQDKIKEGRFQFSNSISDNSKDLIMNMLQPDSLNRFSLQQVIESKWTNIGYDIPINNYLVKRYPLQSINKEHLKHLSLVSKFQFKNLEREVLRYYSICMDKESLEHDYWTKRPVISMYYMLTEIFEDDNSDDSITDLLMELEEDNLTNEISFSCDDSTYLEDLHKFVNYVISKEKRSPCSKFYNKTVFKNSVVTEHKLMTHPIIKNTYIRGMFRGIKIKHVGTHNALKKIIIDLLNMHRLSYKITEKYFLCDVSYNTNIFVSFKISMYYNVILSEYYINVTHVSGEKEEFSNIYDSLYNSLKEQNVL